MGRATLINGLVATGAGVVSNKLVAATDNFKAPFIASAMLLVLAWFVIGGTWSENYGGGGGVVDPDVFQINRLGRAWNIVRRGTCITHTAFSIRLSLIHSRLVLGCNRPPSSRSWTYANLL